MIRLAIFARTFSGSSLDEIVAKIASHGFREVHFNFACAGLEPLPHVITRQCCQDIRLGLARHGVTMAGVSGTYNAIHPDVNCRSMLTRRACQIIDRCAELECSFVSLCTGTRNAADMWQGHPANQDPRSWDDLCGTLTILLESAQRRNVVLGIEPEHNNVINSAAQARRLLDQFSSPHLKIILDPANLVDSSSHEAMDRSLHEAFALLRGDIVTAHAKDIPRVVDGSQAPGAGVLNWRSYLRHLIALRFAGPLVLHGIQENEVDSSKRFLEELIGELSGD